MHDVNPLGPMMHLRELERKAASTLNRTLQKEPSSDLRSLRSRLAAGLKRIRVSFRPSAFQAGSR